MSLLLIPRELNRRTFLSRARNLAVGGWTAAAALGRPAPATTPPAPMPETPASAAGAGSIEAYFIPIQPRAGRPAIAVMRGE